MKQIDRIKQMNAEEMAEILNKTILGIDCYGCGAESRCIPCVYSISTDMSCKDVIKVWLESEVEE